ncbi:MAG TPA: response regulator [Roseiflexaceae bacterium]|nr:response regulator [Roseiflexaceae bacterium]
MSPRSILIVDDEANQRLMLEQALRSLDELQQIVTAASVREALDWLAQHTPDLIITDYHMPGVNGLTLIAHVREQAIPTRIILITAYNSPELQEAAQRLQVAHCLTKPVPLALLRTLTTSVLEGPPAHASAA